MEGTLILSSMEDEIVATDKAYLGLVPALSITFEHECESSHHTFRLNTAAGTMMCALAATRENSRPMSGSFMSIAGPLSACMMRKVRTERPAEPDLLSILPTNISQIVSLFYNAEPGAIQVLN